MGILSGTFNSMQKWLFPVLEEEIGELSEKQKEFVRVVEAVDLSQYVGAFQWKGTGRKRENRLSILKAFVAKSVFGYRDTKAMLENLRCNPAVRRLCGWECGYEIPSRATFSRAFAEFAESELPQKIHEGIVKKYVGEKLVGHISRDSTSIDAREKAVEKEKPPKKEKSKKGRPKKGEKREKKEAEVRRLEKQPFRSLEENLADLSKDCDWGAKYDSNGNMKAWRGYKMHIDTMDGDIPVSAFLTSASVHDSQVAIPLMQMSDERVLSLYDLMDSAYDAPEIREFSVNLGHVPIIDYNKRRGEAKELEPARKLRYRERSAAERVNSNLKDNYGGGNIRVQGNKKVFAHLMFGIIAITVNQLYNMLL
jgi:hypothetical protein